MGLGIELFRLDAVSEEELTAEEAEEAGEHKEEATGTALMRIYEEIGEDFWTGGGVTAKKFAEELDGFGDIKRLHIHINSLGGDAFTAQAIHSIISDHKSRKTSYIDGVAASAATIIACGANEVVARMNSTYMIHYPWGMAVGGAETMRKAADDLDAITIPIVNVYKAQVREKIDEDEIRELMANETWMDAEEALEHGFVDRIKGKIKAIAKVNKSQILCSGRLLDLGRYHYHNVPKFPMIAKAKAEEPEPKQKEIKTMASEKIEPVKTREMIDPKLLTEIQNEAKVAERTRLAALDGMNGPGLSEIVAKAKAEDKQPNEIAMECLAVTKGQLNSAQAVSALARDAKPANNLNAGEAPTPKPEKDRVKEATKLIANAFANARPKPKAAMAS